MKKSEYKDMLTKAACGNKHAMEQLKSLTPAQLSEFNPRIVHKKNFIGRLLCWHNGDKNFVKNIYADQINLWNCRSFWQCTKCGAMLKSQSLHDYVA